MKKLLLFGAGKIGRSFIAPIFDKAGYKIVFVDIDTDIVELINSRKSYEVYILDSNNPENEKVIQVKNISAIQISETEKLIKEIKETDIITISVGKRGMLNLAETISKGLLTRFNESRQNSVNIILAENIKDAAELFRESLEKYLPNSAIKNIGLIETSIGKMVPIMTAKQLKKDPLAVYAEPYNDLIVDEIGFINGVPKIKGLAPKKNMKAWVDRKIYIHNMGHAVLAYQANFTNPSLKYTWEALENEQIKTVTKNAMTQSAEILMAISLDEFTKEELTMHIDDLLDRFSNQALGDTIFRVGCDLSRKLNSDDRLMLPILEGFKKGVNYSLILESWVKACYFSAKDEKGLLFSEDKKFKERFGENPPKILEKHCKLDRIVYAKIYSEVEQICKRLKL